MTRDDLHKIIDHWFDIAPNMKTGCKMTMQIELDNIGGQEINIIDGSPERIVLNDLYDTLIPDKIQTYLLSFASMEYVSKLSVGDLSKINEKITDIVLHGFNNQNNKE